GITACTMYPIGAITKCSGRVPSNSGFAGGNTCTARWKISTNPVWTTNDMPTTASTVPGRWRYCQTVNHSSSRVLPAGSLCSRPPNRADAPLDTSPRAAYPTAAATAAPPHREGQGVVRVGGGGGGAERGVQDPEQVRHLADQLPQRSQGHRDEERPRGVGDDVLDLALEDAGLLHADGPRPGGVRHGGGH